MYFDWKDIYNVDVEQIDNQHRKLLFLGGKIAEMVLMDDGIDHYDEIMEVLEELKSYTKYHFRCEEELMEKHGYEDCKLHKLEHDFLIKKISKIERKDIDEMQNEVLLELIKFVSDWIAGHILQTDMKYKEFFNQKGVC